MSVSDQPYLEKMRLQLMFEDSALLSSIKDPLYKLIHSYEATLRMLSEGTEVSAQRIYADNEAIKRAHQLSVEIQEQYEAWDKWRRLRQFPLEFFTRIAMELKPLFGTLLTLHDPELWEIGWAWWRRTGSWNAESVTQDELLQLGFKISMTRLNELREREEANARA